MVCLPTILDDDKLGKDVDPNAARDLTAEPFFSSINDGTEGAGVATQLEISERLQYMIDELSKMKAHREEEFQTLRQSNDACSKKMSLLEDGKPVPEETVETKTSAAVDEKAR